jgi:hypothetical protein
MLRVVQEAELICYGGYVTFKHRCCLQFYTFSHCYTITYHAPVELLILGGQGLKLAVIIGRLGVWRPGEE